MDVDNENIEPVTDTGLSLGYSSYNTQTRLNNDFGAGANAASRIDMTYVAADPLSELVWSPRNGLSLKYAECSFSEKKPSNLWGARPSNIVLSPQIVTAGRCSNDIHIDANFSTSLSHMSTGVGVDTLDKSPSPRYTVGISSMGQSDHEHQADKGNSFPGTGAFVEKMNNMGETSLLHLNELNDPEDSKGGVDTSGENNHQVTQIDVANQDAAQIDPLFNGPVGGARDVGSGDQMKGTEVFLVSEVHAENKYVACKAPEQDLLSPGREHEKSNSFIGKESKLEIRKGSSPSLFPSEKLEATAENDFPIPISRSECGTSKVAASKSDHEVEMNFQQDEKTLPKLTVSRDHSPTRKIHRYQRKGKEKALSDGDVKGRMSEEEDDSHESVESCNSKRLFSSGKRRWGFDQQLIAESKRVKKQIQRSPVSSSFNKQDSSFMNWISNMMKGFMKSKVETPSLAHTVAHLSHGDDSTGKDLETFSKNQDLGCRNFGFQSMFRSIYCPKRKVQDTTTLDENQTKFELANKTFDMDATPIACHGENISCHRMLLLQNDRFKESTSGDVAGPATELKISSVDFTANQRNSEASSAENNNPCNLLSAAEKDGRSSSSSLGKRKVMNTENIYSDTPIESKAAHNIGYKTDPLSCLWIARFTPKGSGPLLNQDNHNQSASGVIECSTDRMKLIPTPENYVNISNNIKVVETRRYCGEEPVMDSGKELQNDATETKVSMGFNRIPDFPVQDDQKSACKLNPIVSSTRFKNSEVIASLFARRLDALKHIMPSGISENGAPAVITCFFCGRKGHHLQYCSEITDAEIEELVRNIKSNNEVEESPSVCIRCFQVNHWAIACPSASSRRQQQSGIGASLANDSKMHCSERNEEIPKLMNGNENQNAAVSCTEFDGNETRIRTNIDYLTTSDRMRASTDLNKKNEASSSGANKSKENQITSLFNFISQQVSDVPKEIFDAIKLLRLSRMDVLKWMNSQMSPSHLDGFFLRLRLGKWEEVLGGTGYYVAQISEAQRLNSQRNSKSSISVNVGGIKCLVESQYISNHDFLEDELMAWWRATMRSGDKIPSEEELRMKVEERRLLGF
ncbi:hypothetical protein SLE2022_250300 [Rubroshorea leprosula]